MSPLPNPVTNKVIYRQESFSPIIATGGTVYDITIDGAKYRVHEFTTVGTSTFTVSSLGSGLHPYSPGNPANSVEYLVVAGGGGGAGRVGGGGGAGGYRCSVLGELSGGNTSAELPLTLTVGIYTAIVGNGGAAGSDRNWWDTPSGQGTNGGNSEFAGVVALGGGGGGGTDGRSGNNGGSGGGGGRTSNPPGGSGNPGLGTTGQGNSGGSAAQQASGGGGGAGVVGQNASLGGNGGNGLVSSITGISVARAGGGGAGAFPSPVRLGGSGGGGNGSSTNSVAGSPGVVNTGGGGGGGGSDGVRNSAPGGAGGSGIVIIRYPIM